MIDSAWVTNIDSMHAGYMDGVSHGYGDFMMSKPAETYMTYKSFAPAAQIFPQTDSASA